MSTAIRYEPTWAARASLWLLFGRHRTFPLHSSSLERNPMLVTRAPERAKVRSLLKQHHREGPTLLALVLVLVELAHFGRATTSTLVLGGSARGA